MQDIQSVKDEYGNYLLAKRSRNGVFSVKLFPHQWQQLTEIVAHRRDIVDLHFILLEREDIAEQTISILATMLSRRPSFSDLILPGLAKIAEIDRNLVQRTFNWLIEKETQWPSLVASLGGSLHRLTSEDLIDNPAETLSALADKLGLPFDQAATCHAIELEKDGTYQTNLQIKGEIRMRYSHFLIELMSNARRR